MINKRLLSLAVAGTMLLGLSSLAAAGIPDDTLSTATSAGGTVLVTPAGTGDTLGSKGATISVNVQDVNGVAIAGYPFQDIWADDIGNGDVALCQGGSVADANTDASGNTTISGAIAGGGSTQAGMKVYLAGTPLAGAALAINVNSPDITGDLKVDLADIGQFATDFSGAYDFRSDFVADGVINLADVGQLGLHNGEVCP
jgi:hypothetical protein